MHFSKIQLEFVCFKKSSRLKILQPKNYHNKHKTIDNKSTIKIEKLKKFNRE